MSGAKEKTRFPQAQSDGTKNRVPQRTSDLVMGKKAQTPVAKLPQPGTSRVVQPTPPQVNENTKEKEKKKLKTKDSRQELQKEEPRRRIEKQDLSSGKEPQWFQGDGSEDEEEGREHQVQKAKKDSKPKDNWDEMTEQEEDSEEESGGGLITNPLIEKTATARTGALSGSSETGNKLEEAPILTRISKADKDMMRALVKIASLVGENTEVQEQLDNVLTAHGEMKNIIMEQTQEISFQKGRITELERTPVQNEEGQGVQPKKEDIELEQQKPSYALVVSSGSLERKDVAKLIKEQVDLSKLGIQEATMRPGREGVVITTTSKEAVGKLQTQLQTRAAFQQLQIKKPKEHLYNVKIIGLDEDTDIDTLTENMVKQNCLTCEPTDIKVLKTWKGKRGGTVVLALNRRGVKAMKDKTHVNIGWNRCPVFDHIFLPRCTRCAAHGHSANVCDGPMRCVWCGREGHHSEECRNVARCRVCVEERRNTDQEHPMMSWDCPVYRDRLDAEKRRILARLN